MASQRVPVNTPPCRPCWVPSRQSGGVCGLGWSRVERIGAKKRNIMTQFIVEAIVLCEVGGVLGVLLGILGGNGVAYALEMPVVIPVDWILLGLFICSLVGILF